MAGSRGRAPGTTPEPGLGAALAVSALLHLVVLARVPLPQVVRHAGGAIPLTVTIGQHQLPAPAEPPRRELLSESPVAASPSIQLVRPGQNTPPARRDDADAAAEPRKGSRDETDSGMPDQRPSAGQTATVVRQTEPAPSTLLPGHARVLLLVGPSGVIEQIIWKQLPPLDDRRFDELERRVRDRRYAESDERRTINEVIDVLATLRSN